jgi:hypothetical protein
MIAFSVMGEDIINKRAYLLLFRRKPLRPLTRIRMIHDSPQRNAWIRLSAIKIQDLKFGPIIYYEFDRKIYYEAMISATIHTTLTPRLRFCSLHTFAPNFVQLRTDTFSNQRITTRIIQQCETNGVLLTPELNWIEDFVFVLFFMISLFFFNILFAIKLRENFDNLSLIVVSALLSSGLSFNSTNITAFFYRRFIKNKYNTYCSPQLIESDEDSLFWTLLKNLSLTYLFCVSVVISSFIPPLIDYNQKETQIFEITLFENRLANETMILVLFFTASLIISLTFWLLFIGFIKYIYISCFSVIKYIPYESIVQNIKETTAGSEEFSTEDKITIKRTPKTPSLSSQWFQRLCLIH